MAEFKFSCPQCGQRIQCDTSYSGMQINCPVCQKPIAVPQTPLAAAAPVQPPAAASSAIRRGTPALAAGRQSSTRPVSAKPQAWRNVWVRSALAVVFSGLVIGGWYGCLKIKFHNNPVLNTPNLLGYWRFSPDAQTKSSFGTNLAIFSGNAIAGPAGSGPRRDTLPFCLMAPPRMRQPLWWAGWPSAAPMPIKAASSPGSNWPCCHQTLDGFFPRRGIG